MFQTENLKRLIKRILINIRYKNNILVLLTYNINISFFYFTKF